MLRNNHGRTTGAQIAHVVTENVVEFAQQVLATPGHGEPALLTLAHLVTDLSRNPVPTAFRANPKRQRMWTLLLIRWVSAGCSMPGPGGVPGSAHPVRRPGAPPGLLARAPRGRCRPARRRSSGTGADQEPGEQETADASQSQHPTGFPGFHSLQVVGCMSEPLGQHGQPGGDGCRELACLGARRLRGGASWPARLGVSITRTSVLRRSAPGLV